MHKDRDDLITATFSNNEGGLVALQASGRDVLKRSVRDVVVATGLLNPPQEFFDDLDEKGKEAFGDDRSIDMMLLSFEDLFGDIHEYIISPEDGYHIAEEIIKWVNGLIESGRRPCQCGKGHRDD